MELTDINLIELIERETGEKFNQQGCMRCPFHAEKTPSLRVKFFPDKNKEQYHCFGCEAHGDAIDFITNYKGLSFNEARKYLGFEVKKTDKELQEEKVMGYINWELDHFRKGQQFLGIFRYVDKNNNIVYFKGKFKKEDGKKEHFYYHIENNKVIATRGGNEVPYNLYNVIQGMDNKTIIFVEGEKDANNLNVLLRNENYVVTSIKGIKDEKDLEIIQEKGMNVFVIGDTGEAGDIYKWKVYKYFYRFAKVFKFINLSGIKALGDNKDVTDWLEHGHSKDDLLRAFDRSLDLKNKYELQQDKGGVYKTILKEKSDEVIEIKKYLTDFKILEAKRIDFIDDEIEGVKLILKSPTGQILERIGPSTVFDDTKTFKNFLGSLDLGFKGKVDDLTDLKGWINKYFALENEEIYGGVKFIEKDGQIIFVENEGALFPGGKINKNIKSDKRNNIEVIAIPNITKEELKELKKHLFRFTGPEKSISIIGTIINNLMVYQAIQPQENFLHHLLIVGESGSGKSTALKNVVAPILNYPRTDILSMGSTTSFALIKTLSDGNYSAIFDEFKPSTLDKYKILNISDTLRNLFDRQSISKGNKSLKTKKFHLKRPIIIAGEESYVNHEQALIERSCIVYFSRRERTKETKKEIDWLIENENIVNKFGRSLIELALEISTDEYKEIRKKAESNVKNLEYRVLNTAINIYSGIEILNKLFKKYGIKEIKNFEEHIINNLKSEVLEDNEETHSIVEQMIILYNEMIEDGRSLSVEDVIKCRDDGLFIKTSEMINQIHEHVNRFCADLIPLKLRDFKKQAQKAGYLVGSSDKVIKVGGKAVRFDTYNKELVQKLKVDLIAPPDFAEVHGKEKVVPFDKGYQSNKKGNVK